MAQHEVEAAPAEALREVRHEYTLNFGPLLARLGGSLLVSTYHAGKLISVSADGDKLQLGFHNFDRAMGLAVSPRRIAVGSRTQVWFLNAAHDLAARVAPAGRHDACYLTRSAHVTGDIQLHEMAWAGDELWLVNVGRDTQFFYRLRPPLAASPRRCLQLIRGVAHSPLRSPQSIARIARAPLRIPRSPLRTPPRPLWFEKPTLRIAPTPLRTKKQPRGSKKWPPRAAPTTLRAARTPPRTKKSTRGIV